MNAKGFEEQVCQYVRNALPQELKDVEVYVTKLDIGEGHTRMVLLVIRPWDHTATGFDLDAQYKRYVAGDATVESIVAPIINDRRLYNTSIK